MAGSRAPDSSSSMRQARSFSNATHNLPFTGGVAGQSLIDLGSTFEDPQASLLGMSFSGTPAIPRTFDQAAIAAEFTSLDDASQFGAFSQGYPFNSSDANFVVKSSTQASHQILSDSSNHVFDTDGDGGLQTVGFPSDLRSTGPWTHLNAETQVHHPDRNTHSTAQSKSLIATPQRGRRSSNTSHPSNLDSGYGTGSKSQHDRLSIAGAGIIPVDPSTQNLSMSYFDLRGLQAPSSALTRSVPHSEVVDGAQSLSGSVPPNSANNLILSCTADDCSFKGRTPSDMKKHEARHKRAFVCMEPNCTMEKGFANSNDLHRHQKSVHAMNVGGKDYKCFAAGCGRASKVWSRLDNFKYHLKKLHPHEDTDHLIKRSEGWYDALGQQDDLAETASVSGSISLTPMQPQTSMQSSFPVLNVSSTQSDCGGYSSWQPTKLPTFPTDPRLGPPNDPRISNNKTRGRGGSRGLKTAPVRNSASRSRPSPYAVPEKAKVPNFNGQRRTQSQSHIKPQQPQQTINPGALQQYATEHQQTDPLQQYQSHLQTDVQTEPCFPIDSIYNRPHTIADLRERLELNRIEEDLFGDALPVFPTNLEGTTLASQTEVLMGMDQTIGSMLNYGSVSTQLNSSPFAPQVVINPPSEQGIPDDAIHNVAKVLADEIQKSLDELSTNQTEIGRTSWTTEYVVQRLRHSLQSTILSLKGIEGVGASSKSQVSVEETEISETMFTREYLASGEVRFICRFPGCNKDRSRKSDMKKHYKRHTRPYGCTYDLCTKRSGSKNDWKRHEQKKHQQEECWRCDYVSSVYGQPCNQVFYHDREFFRNHLHQDHGLTNPTEIEAKLKNRRIPAKNQGGFWCGFCNDIKRIHVYGAEVDNVRLNHINDHMQGENKEIGNWIELGGKGRTKNEMSSIRSKARIEREMSESQTVNDDGTNENDAGENQSSSSSSPESLQIEPLRHDSTAPSHSKPPFSANVESGQLQESQHWVATAGSSLSQSSASACRQSQPTRAQPQNKQEILTTCCNCNHQQLRTSGSRCTGCDHENDRCPYCEQVLLRPLE